MIPKIIHYCWFGKGKMPQLAMVCIQSWQKYLPDYELNLWNEETFDVYKIPYVREAYESKKYAFVTDYVRLHALYNFGGVYMDTDVEVLKSLDDLLKYPAFSGFESKVHVPTGIMASIKNGVWVKEQLDYYSERKFIRTDGSFDVTTNVEIISKIMASNGFKLNNEYQVYKNEIHMFPKDYFCPKEHSGKINLTKNSYCIHHFSGSWTPLNIKIKKYFFQNILGSEITDILVSTKRKIIKKLQF